MKWWKWVLLVLSAVVVGMQFVRPSRENPPIAANQTIEATENLPSDVHAIFDRSCSDCHSHKTVWPWYSNVAPVSWLLVDDVKKGRKELNLSEWGTYKPRRKARKLEEICDEVREREMPLKQYLWLHPHAKLSDAERARLCEWANALTANAPKPSSPS